MNRIKPGPPGTNMYRCGACGGLIDGAAVQAGKYDLPRNDETLAVQNDPRRMGYQSRLIAFLDLLGFSRMVDNSLRDPSVVVHIHKILAAVRKVFPQWDDSNREKEESYLRLVRELKPAIRGFTFGSHELFRTSMFSDNVAFSGPPNPTGFMVLVPTAAFLWLNLIRYGILLRGGLTSGLLHHSETQIFGPALVECHELESRVAKYPRIVVSKSFVNVLRQNEGRHDLPDNFALFRRDADDMYHVHTLSPLMADIVGLSDRKAYLLRLQGLISRHLDTDAGLDDRVREKWDWLAAYFRETVAAEPHLGIDPM